MIRDPRSTKYIYNIQITAPPNEIDKGRHIVIGSDKKRNLKLGYSNNNAWIHANGTMKLSSANNNIEVGNLSINNNETILKNTDKVSVINAEGKGFTWNNNIFTSNNGLRIFNEQKTIEIDSGLNFKGGNSIYNPLNNKTQMPNDMGINNIGGDTLLYGNLNILGNNIINNNLETKGSGTFMGGKNISNRNVITEIPINILPTQFPNNNGYNFISGDTNVDGDMVLFGNATINKNIKSFGNVTATSLDITGKSSSNMLEVNGYSNLRGLTSTKPIIIPGGQSIHNPKMDNTLLPSEIDKTNYIRGDTTIDGNIKTPGNISMNDLYVNGITKMEKNLSVNGDVNITGRLTTGNSSFIPTGIIVMWSGAINNIPKGWLLCDGKNKTPDLRSRFIIGSGSDYGMGNKNDIGKTGGNTMVTLQISNLPAHHHSVTLSGNSLTSASNCWKRGDCSGDRLTSPGTISGVTNDTGSGIPIDITPSFYALAFIMKVDN